MFHYYQSYKLKFELHDLRFTETNFETLSSGPRLGKTSMNESSWSAVEIEKFGAGAVGVWPVHLYVFIDGSWFGAGQIPSLIILLVTEHVWEIISFNYVLVWWFVFACSRLHAYDQHLNMVLSEVEAGAALGSGSTWWTWTTWTSALCCFIFFCWWSDRKSPMSERRCLERTGRHEVKWQQVWWNTPEV